MSPIPKMLGAGLKGSRKLQSVVEGSEPATQDSTHEHTPIDEESKKQEVTDEVLQTPVGVVKRRVVWDDEEMTEHDQDFQENPALGALSSQSRKVLVSGGPMAEFLFLSSFQ